MLASHPTEPHPTDQRSLDLQESLNLNIASYFINTLASSLANTWQHRGGTITHKIDHFFRDPNHRRSVEHIWKTLISCIELGVKYTGRNVTKNHGRPYLLYSSYEINLIANSRQNCLGLRYTTLLINFHRQTQGENAVSRFTVNLAFMILQPKITKINKTKKGTNNEGKWNDQSVWS